MKRLRSLVALLVLVVMLAAILPISAIAEQKMKVTSNYLRMRTGPGLEYSIKGRYKKGTVVTLLKTSKKWCYVRTKTGVKGWMYKDNLKKTNTPVVAAQESASGTAVTTKNAKLRRGPGTSYDTRLVVHRGKVVRILGKTGSWYKVKYDGKTGFIYKSLLRITK